MHVLKCRISDGDGLIGRREFKRLLKYLIYFNGLWHRFEKMDRNRDRRLDLAEFIAGSSQIGHRMRQKEAKQQFERMDANGGGYVLFEGNARF